MLLVQLTYMTLMKYGHVHTEKDVHYSITLLVPLTAATAAMAALLSAADPFWKSPSGVKIRRDAHWST
jgi:hypothetical protein